MKKLVVLTIMTLLSSTFIIGQDENTNLDAPLGLRIKKNGNDYLIYADYDLSPNFKDNRKINYQVYFRIVDHPIKDISGVKYQLVTIPGNSDKQNQDKFQTLANGTIVYPRAGKTVNAPDYDQNFWMEVDVIDNETQTEYYKYANDVFSGLLTAPFKYRLKSGDSPESLIDGDFNIAPFLGWKWRVSSTRPFYLAPFGFAGVTSLNYNSANNSNITDSEQLENGTGLTYGLGLSFRFGDVSPGFIIGWDKGFGDLGEAFKYNDTPWISFSVNYDFFKPNKTEEGNK